jgi:hypothetical protein
MSNSNDTDINDLKIRVEGLKDWLKENDVNSQDSINLKHRFTEMFDKLEGQIRSSAPALHLSFDDRGGTPVITSSPSIHVRFGDELERVCWISPTQMDIPEVTSALGRKTADICRNFFHLSEVVREIGYPGITALLEMDDEELDLIEAPLLPTEDQPEFV